MTQEAIVTRRLPDGMAEVVVTRGTACGSNCGNCESCIFQSELKTHANNLIDAQPGQRVIIQSKSSKIFGAALLVSMWISSLAGTTIPLAFKKMGVDPAVASGPLITTINDLVAVVAYYGLTWVLLLGVLDITKYIV